MAAPPCPACCANTLGAAAIAVAAAPVASMLRLIGSIIGVLLGHCYGWCARLEMGDGPAPPARFQVRSLVRRLCSTVFLAPKDPLGGPEPVQQRMLWGAPSLSCGLGCSLDFRASPYAAVAAGTAPQTECNRRTGLP